MRWDHNILKTGYCVKNICTCFIHAHILQMPQVETDSTDPAVLLFYGGTANTQG